MIDASVSRDLILYMLWADRQMLKAVRPVSREDLTRDAGVSFKSMLGTMAHMVGAMEVWLSRFSGKPLAALPTLDAFPDLLSWITHWEEVAAEIEAFLASLTDEHLAEPLTWTSFAGETYTRPLWQAVVHWVNHSTYHRGQVISLLRQMGYAAPSTDMIYWFIERGGS